MNRQGPETSGGGNGRSRGRPELLGGGQPASPPACFALIWRATASDPARAHAPAPCMLVSPGTSTDQ